MLGANPALSFMTPHENAFNASWDIILGDLGRSLPSIGVHCSGVGGIGGAGDGVASGGGVVALRFPPSPML